MNSNKYSGKHGTAAVDDRLAVARRRLAIYLAFTFVLSWGIWIPAGLALGTFEHGEASSPAMMALIAAGMFLPLVGALVANRVCGQQGSIDLCLRPNIKGNVRLYLAAWFLPALITLLGDALFFALNPQLFDPTFSGYLQTMADMAQSAGASASDELAATADLADKVPLVIASTIVVALTIAPFINAIPSFGEEVGWRGMLFPTLCELMPARAAMLVSGVIWGLWHAPIIAMGHNYGMGYVGFPWAGIMVMTAACTAMGACLAYLRRVSLSVWPCSLAHGAFNAIANTGIAFSLGGQMLAGPTPLGYVAGIPLVALGIVCWLKMPE